MKYKWYVTRSADEGCQDEEMIKTDIVSGMEMDGVD